MNPAPAIELLEGWLQQRLTASESTSESANESADEPDSGWQWLNAQIEKTLQSNSGKDLYITLGMVPRKLSRQDLGLTREEIAQADAARSGWDPSLWSIAGAARILVLAKVAQARGNDFGQQYQELCRTADVSESIELHAALPLLPASKEVDQQVGEGLRTNMKAIFESIAHRNPYPRETFDKNRWNHMVLKALFVDSTLAPIQGLDERANDELAGILCDYAHERWAANRSVTCELWRCVGPYARGDRVQDLARALGSDDPDSQRAAAIALAQSPDVEAAKILSTQPELAKAVETGMIQWQGAHSAPVVLQKNAGVVPDKV